MTVTYPLVSVIIPCWNAEGFIGEAIESALAQTYPHVEVIVVDDGSTDSSLTVLRPFEDRICFETGPNRGASSARNRGLKLAQGELIQFLDADDLLHAEKLEKMVPVALSVGPTATPICNWTTIPEDKPEERILSSPQIVTGEDSVLFCLRSQLQTTSPLHQKANLIAVEGFDTALSCSQERDLHLRLACQGIDFVHLPQSLALVRRRPNSISSDLRCILRAHGGIFERAFNQLFRDGSLCESRRRAFARAVAHDARMCLRHGETGLAREYFALAKSMSNDGSLEAFGHSSTRTIAKVFGPIWAERVCQAGVAFGIRP